MKRELTVVSTAVVEPGGAVDVSFVPPLARRRLSPLQKIFFALAQTVGGTTGATIFACRDGEASLTRRLVDDFRADGSVSPNRFSTSVYNAAPGLWSVQTKNTAPYTAIAAGEETIECGLLEAMAATPLLYVYAEETEGGYGAAVRLEAAGEGRRIEVASADGSAQPISFRDWADFLQGRRHELKGRWLEIRDLADA